MTDSRASEAAAMLQDRCVGRVLDEVLAHGINSLKTVGPPLSAITGIPLETVSASDEAVVEIDAGPFALSIDLQRTGRLKLDDLGRQWSPGEPSMPTIQLVFEGGLVANFVEPGKTKRITLRAAPRG